MVIKWYEKVISSDDNEEANDILEILGTPTNISAAMAETDEIFYHRWLTLFLKLTGNSHTMQGCSTSNTSNEFYRSTP